MPPRKVVFGFGSHEPIMHRLRTGNANAQEWERWEREVSIENLDLLSELGTSNVNIACAKGFGMEAEKHLVERAAKFTEEAHARGIKVRIYTQGLPVYYETFFQEVPEAVNWLGVNQMGEHIPWGSQMFRRWMSPWSEEFLEYQEKLIAYCTRTVQPDTVGVDNSSFPSWPQLDYSEHAIKAWKKYLADKFKDQDTFKIFGLSSLDCVDLPRFDPTYFHPMPCALSKIECYRNIPGLGLIVTMNG